jgi:hypothetical protein
MTIRSSNSYPKPPAWVLGVLGLAATAPAQAQVTYSGEALAATVGSQTFADTGELPPEGGLLSASLTRLQTTAATAQDLVAQTTGANHVARSTASLESVVLFGGTTAEILVASAQTDAAAACDGTSVRAQGSSTVAGLFAGGQAIAVTGEPNQNVPLSDGTLILNEQAIYPVEGGQVISISALHFIPTEGAQVALASARAGLADCSSLPRDCPDFVTGSGSITVGASRGTFGLNAGFKPNSSTPSVAFNYIDHLTHMHVKATTVESYRSGATSRSRRFEGTAKIDGVPGGYAITVVDDGDDGDADTFELALSTGYVVGGLVNGGNITLHKPCP